MDNKWHSVRVCGSGAPEHREYRFYIDGCQVSYDEFHRRFPNFGIPESKPPEAWFAVNVNKDDKIAYSVERK